MPNTPGDYMVRRNTAETDTIPDEGTDLDAGWDTQVSVEGSSITYSGGTFTLASGKYFISYGENFNVSSLDARVEMQCRLVVAGSEVLEGCGQQYAEQSTMNEAAVSGGCILDVASDSTTLITRFFRTDDSTISAGNRPARLPDWSGITILALDENWNYGRYSFGSAATLPSGTTYTDMIWDTTDEEEGPFSRSGADITIATAGRYLCCISAPIRTTNTSIYGFTSRVVLDDVLQEGTQVTTFIRGSGACQDGCLSVSGIIQVAAGEVFTAQWNREQGADNGDGLTGGNIQIVQLPVGNECIIVEEQGTGGENMNPDTETLYTWEAVPEIDTDAFSHSAGGTTIAVDVTGPYLFFCTQYELGAGSARMSPEGRFGINGAPSNSLSVGSYYLRGTGGGGGHSHAALYDLTADDTVGVYNVAGGVSGSMNCDGGRFSAVRLGSIFAAAPAGGDLLLTQRSIQFGKGGLT